jgi:hypothetical protein
VQYPTDVNTDKLNAKSRNISAAASFNVVGEEPCSNFRRTPLWFESVSTNFMNSKTTKASFKSRLS